jgi:hypothetical protein
MFQQHLLDEIMRVKGVQILQKGLYEGTREGRWTFVCVFTSHHQYEGKKTTTAV